MFLVVLTAGMGLWGCPHNQGFDTDASEVAPHPFDPASVRVYPLTQLELSESGDPRIICHFEFKDRWGDTVRAIGLVEISLYRDASGMDTRPEQVLTWTDEDLDLTNLERNLVLWDPATRTYRVTLIGLPDWMRQVATGEGGGRALLRVWFAPASGGEPLMDEYLLHR